MAAAKLPKFEGKETVGAALTLHKTGNGLKSAIQLDPVVLHEGDTIDLVIRAKVTQVAHGNHIRTHQCEAQIIRLVDASTLVDAADAEVVDRLISGQASRIEEARETVEGDEE
jgi:hypothetical protein